MSGIAGFSFTSAFGNYDTASNWVAVNGQYAPGPVVPYTYANILLGSATQQMNATGHDQFGTLYASGAVAGGADNTVNVTGTLAGNISQFTNYTLLIESGGTVSAPGATFSGASIIDHGSLAVATGGFSATNTDIEIFTQASIGSTASLSGTSLVVEQGGSLAVSQLALSGSTMDVFGYETITNGGGGKMTNSAIVVESTGTLVSTALAGGSADTLIVNGTLELTGGGPGLGMSSTINAGGQVTLDGTESTGTVWNINGGTLSSSVAYQNGVFNFSGTGGVLDLPNNARYNNKNITVTGFNAGDSLVLGTITGTSPVTATIVNGHRFELLQDGNVVAQIDHFTMAPGATLSSSAGSIVNGHYVVNYCFCADTRLATEDGEIAVQDVVPGTMLKTADGALLPVRWVGWSEVDLYFADPLRALPIRICAGALAEGVPARDLLVSPDHAIFLDGILVQAGALVNGVSVLREEAMPRQFRYYHIELATHELLLAENCPAESFVDNVDRMNFHNWDARTAPDEAVAEMPFPRAKSARQVPVALRSALAERAALIIPPCAA